MRLGRGSFFSSCSTRRWGLLASAAGKPAAMMSSVEPFSAEAETESSGSRSFRPRPEGRGDLRGARALLRPGPKSPSSPTEVGFLADTSPGPTPFTRSDAIGFLRKRRARLNELGSEEPPAAHPAPQIHPANRTC